MTPSSFLTTLTTFPGSRREMIALAHLCAVGSAGLTSVEAAAQTRIDRNNWLGFAMRWKDEGLATRALDPPAAPGAGRRRFRYKPTPDAYQILGLTNS